MTRYKLQYIRLLPATMTKAFAEDIIEADAVTVGHDGSLVMEQFQMDGAPIFSITIPGGSWFICAPEDSPVWKMESITTGPVLVQP